MPPRKPPIREIADDLELRITTGEWSPGEKLPSTRELAAAYEVGEKTIYRAISLLKAGGRVIARQGAGVTVREIRPFEWPLHKFERGVRRDSPDENLDDWKAIAREQGREPSQDTPQVTVEKAPEDVARWLRVPLNTHVVCRRRVRRLDDEPFQLADSWFPARIALDTPLMEEREITMPGGILASIGHPQHAIRDEIRSWPPASPEEAERLELPKGIGTPVTRHARVGFDAEGKPIRVMVTVAPGPLNTLVYEMEI